MHAALVVLALAGQSDPNTDYWVGVGGPPRALSPIGKLQLERLNVGILANPGVTTYDAVVSNPGARVKAVLAIPEYGVQQAPPRSHFKSLAVSVDGKSVALRRILQTGGGRYSYSHSLLWAFDVPLEAGQSRKVHVKYVADPGYSTGYGHQVKFLFSAGKGWAAPIAVAELVCDLKGLEETSGTTFQPLGASRVDDRLEWSLEGVPAAESSDLRVAWLEGFLDVFVDGQRVMRHTQTPYWDRWDNPLGPIPPMRKGNDVFLAAKAIAGWCDASLQVVTPGKDFHLKRGDRWVQVTVGSKILRTSGGTLAMPGVAKVEGDVAYVWLAPIVDALGGAAKFDPSRRTMDVRFR